jgi:dihydrofolate synthase/folylpolyglutamate synthase
MLGDKPPPDMTYPEALGLLYGLRWFGAKFGLDNTCKLAELAGNPHARLRFIHIAGTNGKGSTAAMLESIYRAAGLRVGLFTSPHLVAFGERIQIDRRLIAEHQIIDLVDEMQKLLAQGWDAVPPAQREGPAGRGPSDHPTFFEVVTVMALKHFAGQRCDLVIWETGLGGRLDATNIVTPLASVITNIQHDHQQYLGETLASIASEKAGIIKPCVPVVTGTDEPEALAVLQAAARKQQAPATIVTPKAAHLPPLNHLQLPLLGEHQKMNAAVALATVRTLQSQITVGDEAILAGLSTVHWPGRLQLVTRPSGQRLLLDGAHNVGGARALAAALRENFAPANPALILGILQEKDWPQMCAILAPLASRILLVPVHSERTATPHDLAGACRHANPTTQVVECNSLATALTELADTPFVTIAGSLYLIGEAFELLGLAPAINRGERELNEWHVHLTK